jgi:hypothetical protein
MLTFYGNLFWLSLRSIPSSLGSNWLGLIWPAVVVAVGEIIACFAYGWRTMIAKWKQATLIGLASLGCCYLALFAWCAVAANYGEYSRLSIANTSLTGVVDTAEARQRYAVLEAQNECAKTLGKNETLGEQNRDQQNTINNCQTQAIKLLQPIAFQWHALALEEAEVSPKTRKQRRLLLTNKVLSPAEFGFSCSHPIIQAETKIVGSVADAKTVQIDKDHWGSQIRSPAWGPDSPALVVMTLAVSSGENTSCNFKLETITK